MCANSGYQVVFFFFFLSGLGTRLHDDGKFNGAIYMVTTFRGVKALTFNQITNHLVFT